jgi:small ligand-binding sensory domain FIST
MSVRTDSLEAAADLADRVGEVGTPDLLLVFASPDHAGRMGIVQDTLRARCGARHIVGVTADGVLAGQTERERTAGLAGIAMSLPGVGIRPFWIDPPPSGDPPEARAGEPRASRSVRGTTSERRCCSPTRSPCRW